MREAEDRDGKEVSLVKRYSSCLWEMLRLLILQPSGNRSDKHAKSKRLDLAISRFISLFLLQHCVLLWQSCCASVSVSLNNCPAAAIDSINGPINAPACAADFPARNCA